jgi:hypothetical protein
MHIITVHGLHFAIEQQGFLRGATQADADRAIYLAVSRLRACDPAKLAEAHAADLAFSGGERDERPELIAEIESEADVESTRRWHDPNGASISLGAHMTDSTFTPVPSSWEMPGKDGDDWVVCTNGRKGKRRTIAHAYTEANAILIAAAPDLLAALQAFLRAPSIGSSGPGSITIEVQKFNIDAARAAIKRATEG